MRHYIIVNETLSTLRSYDDEYVLMTYYYTLFACTDMIISQTRQIETVYKMNKINDMTIINRISKMIELVQLFTITNEKLLTINTELQHVIQHWMDTGIK